MGLSAYPWGMLGQFGRSVSLGLSAWRPARLLDIFRSTEHRDVGAADQLHSATSPDSTGDEHHRVVGESDGREPTDFAARYIDPRGDPPGADGEGEPMQHSTDEQLAPASDDQPPIETDAQLIPDDAVNEPVGEPANESGDQS